MLWSLKCFMCLISSQSWSIFKGHMVVKSREACIPLCYVFPSDISCGINNSAGTRVVGVCVSKLDMKLEN